MCGRGRCTLRPDDITRACYVTSRPVQRLNIERFRPSYNVAPGFDVPVVRRDDKGDGGGGGVVLQCMKWGLIPSFTKKTEKADHFKMFNARSESVREKPSFSRLLPKNRCLVCFEGFYEWKKDGSKKQPYYVHLDGRPLVFAALYDLWKDPQGEILYSFTILTTSPSSSLKWLHDRMPVILGSEESIDVWLNDSSVPNLASILKPYEEADLAWYPVTPAIGKLPFDGPECVEKVKTEEACNKQISQFFTKKGGQELKLDETTIEEESADVKNKPHMKVEAFEDGDHDREINMKNETEESHSSVEPHSSVKNEPNQSKMVQELNTDDDALVCPDRVHHNIPEKRDCDSDLHSTKRGKHDSSSGPMKKRSKGTDKKQPTLFSYYGKT